MTLDKAIAPGTDDAAGDAANVQTTDAGQATAPEVTLTALQQELENERQRRIEAERSYANIRPKLNEHDQELAELRRLRDRVLAGQGEDTTTTPTPTTDPELLNEILAMREEAAWGRFQTTHPLYKEKGFWDEMNEVAKDPRTKATIESFRIVKGRPVLDVYATLHNAYNEVRIRRMEKAQGEATTRKADAVSATNKNRALATISGSGAASMDTGEGEAEFIALVNDPNSDYNDIIKHPYYKQYINAADPPRGI